ncbi:MAG: phosphoribosylformylglycinamidine cyclo-ligase [Thermoplasmata archaeon]
MEGLSYKDAGVDIDKEEEAVSALKDIVSFGRKGIGAPLKSEFTGLVDFGDYALTLCTDGVGTKLLIADEMKKWDTVGIDCIAMNVNDTICHGAEPLAFVDYLAVEEPDPELMKEIAKGLEKGAELSNMTLIGGETATLGDIVKGFDLAGTALGFIKKDDIIEGGGVKEGDKIVGLPSSGVHSNGFTLARKVVEVSKYDYHDELDFGVLGEVLLEPTEIYVKTVLKAVRKFHIKGMANITGGGLRNIKRINGAYGYVIDDPLKPQPIFDLLQEEGNISDKEMYQTFNMGMGYCMVVPAEEAEDASEFSGGKIVGSVVKGEGVKLLDKDLSY